MEEKKSDETQKSYALIRILGVMVLALFMLVSMAGAATFAYITNAGVDSKVSIIDTANDTVIKTIVLSETEQYWPSGVAASKAGTKVYVTNSYKNSVSVIDTATNNVTATIPVGNWPYGIAVTPDGTKVYVMNREDDTVSVIDTATNNVTATVPVGNWPYGVAVTPDGTKVYVTNCGSDNVSVIDTATNNVIGTISLGSQIHEGQPEGVAVTPDGTRVYVVNFGGYYDYDTVSVIDTTNNIVIATVDVGAWPEGIAINPTGTMVYVTNSYSNTISVIDTATNTVKATVTVGDCPCGVSVTPDGKKVYVGNVNSNNVSVIDTSTNNVIATVNVGNNPYAFGQFIASIPVSEPILPVANFSANPTSGKAPLTVVFTDTSTGIPTKWKWSFGDGKTSTQQNPKHKYSKAGNYTVALTVTNDAGSNTTTKTDYVNVIEKPVANFSASPNSGKAPLTVSFTDKSTGIPTKWKWSFGDGTSSTEKNPKHEYSQEGNYKVTLTVTNVVGSSTLTKANLIKVTTNTRPGIYSENK